VIFPSNLPWDPSSNFRAWLVAPELENLGWRVLVVPEPLSLRQRRRFLRLESPDVVLLQQTRHPLNQPCLYRPYPCVLDADDADYLDPRHHERIARCASDAAAVIGGSRFVARCLGQHNPRAHVLWTCAPRPSSLPPVPPAARPPVVAWAHASPLGYREEAALVREVIVGVARRTSVEFWMFGSSEERARDYFIPLREAGATCVAIPRMGYDAYLRKVGEAAVGLQPVCVQSEFSRGKSFGKVLAYLAGQVAVVAADEVDHPLFLRQGENGFLAGPDPESWVTPIVRLLTDVELRQRIAVAGWNDFQARLITGVFARLLDPILREAAGLPIEAAV
jgi:glycosyltransferase involved in cell wall biosynthesis